VSRFSGSFVGKTVQSGSKVQGSAFPTLVVTSTKDKFVLNTKALALMGIGEGQYVVMIDVNRGEVTQEDPNARFYLTKGWDKGKGAFEGAKIGKGGGYSYSGVYSAIQMGKPDISEASVKDMVAAGKGVTRETKSGKDAFIATQKVAFKVEKLVQAGEKDGDPDQTEFEVSDGLFQKVYALTEMDIIAHDPREVDVDAEAATVGDKAGTTAE
jgi:hypothetical protein